MKKGPRIKIFPNKDQGNRQNQLPFSEIPGDTIVSQTEFKMGNEGDGESQKLSSNEGVEIMDLSKTQQAYLADNPASSHLKMEGGDPSQSINPGAGSGNPKNPESSETDALIGFGSKAEKILNQIPPDWDLAQEHGKANLAYDLSKCSNPYDLNSNMFCHCCQRQIPEEDMFYPLGDNYILGELGEGYPVLFQLMKYLNCLLLMMMVIFFIPAIIFIQIAVENYGDATVQEEKISLYSFGALIKFSDPLQYIKFEQRDDFILAYCGLLTLTIIVTFMAMIYIRKLLNRVVEIVDALSFTPSDFCLVGECSEFSDECNYSIKSIESEIRAGIKDRFDIDQIEYVNVAYDIEDIFELLSQERVLLKKRELIKWFMQLENWNEDQYKNTIDQYQEFEDWPCERKGFSSCFAKSPLKIDEVEKELYELQAQIENKVQQTTEGDFSIQKYTGKVFIVLKKAKDLRQVIRNYQDESLIKSFFKLIFHFCFSKKSSLWKFQRAPEPSDIYWQNLGVSFLRRTFMTSLIYIATSLILVLCAFIISQIRQAKDNVVQDARENSRNEKLSLTKQGEIQTISAFSSVSIYIVNSFLIIFIRRLSVFEYHSSITQLNVSVGFKLTVARFVNSSIILIVINYDRVTNWFDRAGLVYDATILMLLMAFSDPILYLINIPRIIKKIRIHHEMRKGDDCQLTQQEANILFEGPQIDIADNLSHYFSLIATCIFFTPIIPFAVPIALVGSLLNYYVFKYMLLRVHKNPEMLSRTMGMFFASLVPFFILIQGIATFIFMQNIANNYNQEYKQIFETTLQNYNVGNLTSLDQAKIAEQYDNAKSQVSESFDDAQQQYQSMRAYAQNELDKKMQDAEYSGDYSAIKDNVMGFPIAGMVCAILCICGPIRAIIRRRLSNEEEDEVDDSIYSDRVLQFTDDYDISNPLTAKKGRIRLLELQISKLEKQGDLKDDTQIKMLKEQQQIVQTQDQRQAMEQFVQNNYIHQMAYQQRYLPVTAMMHQQQAMHNEFMRQQMIRQQMQRNYLIQQQRQMHLMQFMQNQNYLNYQRGGFGNQFLQQPQIHPSNGGPQLAGIPQPHQTQVSLPYQGQQMAMRQQQLAEQMRMNQMAHAQMQQRQNTQNTLLRANTMSKRQPQNQQTQMMQQRAQQQQMAMRQHQQMMMQQQQMMYHQQPHHIQPMIPAQYQQAYPHQMHSQQPYPLQQNQPQPQPLHPPHQQHPYPPQQLPYPPPSPAGGFQGQYYN